MNLIGITGGIGSGKTTVSQVFKDLNFTIIDADAVAREVVEPGRYELEELKNAFGFEIMNGPVLNRRKLGEIVFENSAKLELLNSILQPAIKQNIEIKIDYFKNSENVENLILDIPLLYERGWENKTDFVIVADANLELRISRIEKRDSIDRDAAIQRMRSQIPLAEKVAKADFVIDNNGDKEKTIKQVQDLIKKNKWKP
jgi:dephospho-CoA kinase